MFTKVVHPSLYTKHCLDLTHFMPIPEKHGKTDGFFCFLGYKKRPVVQNGLVSQQIVCQSKSKLNQGKEKKLLKWISTDN